MAAHCTTQDCSRPLSSDFWIARQLIALICTWTIGKEHGRWCTHRILPGISTSMNDQAHMSVENMSCEGLPVTGCQPCSTPDSCQYATSWRSCLFCAPTATDAWQRDQSGPCRSGHQTSQQCALQQLPLQRGMALRCRDSGGP